MKKKTLLIIIVSILIVIVGIRIALPYIIKDYANKKLDEIEGYEGHIDDVDLSIIRGAYVIKGVTLEKTGGKVPVPFFSADRIDLSVEWHALFKGSFVGEIELTNPKLNFVAAKSEAQKQTKPGKNWQDKVKELFPLKIDRFAIINGEVHYRDFTSDPKVNIYISNIQAVANNLTNSDKISKNMVAKLRASGNTMNKGTFKVNLEYDPYAKQPTFSLDASIEKVDLVKLNDFLKAYGNFDVQRGTFGMYTEFAAANGKFEGYVKPFIKDIEVFSWKEKHDNFFQGVWEAITGAVAGLFENKKKEQIATKIPISGRFDDPSVDIWTTIGNLLRNAFIQALVPGIEQSIQIKDLSEKKK